MVTLLPQPKFDLHVIKNKSAEIFIFEKSLQKYQKEVYCLFQK